MVKQLDDILELAEIMEAEWPEISAKLWASGTPLNSEQGAAGGSGDDGGSGAGAGSAGAGDSGSGDEGSDDDDDDDDDDLSMRPADDAGVEEWKKYTRKWEQRAKESRKAHVMARKEKRAREAAEKRLREREAADQTDQEKAIQAAREEGERAARESADKERRQDRLENATLKLAGRGFKIKVKEGNEEVEQTIKFADPDDAFTYIERMLRRGDLDDDDVFDDEGKVNTEALTDALSELLEEKPHLRYADNGNDDRSRQRQRVGGRADTGRGSGGGDKSVEDMSAEEHFQRIRKHK